MTRHFRIAVFAAASIWSWQASAQLEAVEVVLFAPCSQETVDTAIEAARSVEHVDQVQAVVGELRIRILTTPEYRADALEVVQVLWDGKIFPNRIYVEARGHAQARADGWDFKLPSGQSFSVHADAWSFPDPASATALWLRGEVIDWIEDRRKGAGESYLLRPVDIDGSRP